MPNRWSKQERPSQVIQPVRMSPSMKSTLKKAGLLLATRATQICESKYKVGSHLSGDEDLE